MKSSRDTQTSKKDTQERADHAYTREFWSSSVLMERRVCEVDGWLDGSMIVWVDRWVYVCMYGGRKEGRMGVWMDGGWWIGQTDVMIQGQSPQRTKTFAFGKTPS